ncbi:hypothetical protein P692DRAFT_20830824 [Suillus brevipes Sb2]|nr:hypothetical protein P692DRAFT_20830824 [Suillus brevipes Sb2]
MHEEYSSQYSDSPFDGDNDDGTKLLGSGIATPPLKHRFLHLWPWLSHSVLISITLVFFVLWARAPSMDDVVLFSPALEAVESIGTVKFEGTFRSNSIYSKGLLQEIDSAWDSVSFDGRRPVRMTLDQLLRTGEKPSPAMVKYPDEYGGGYMATVEVFHQLHCLDMLRRASHGDQYYHHGVMHESDEEYRTYLDHCIEWLRQSAMCSSDVTMVTREWVSGITTPVANFDGRRECRNFEKILNWVDEHRVFVPPSKLFPLDDNVNLPSPP